MAEKTLNTKPPTTHAEFNYWLKESSIYLRCTQEALVDIIALNNKTVREFFTKLDAGVITEDTILNWLKPPVSPSNSSQHP